MAGENLYREKRVSESGFIIPVGFRVWKQLFGGTWADGKQERWGAGGHPIVFFWGCQ